MIKDPDLVGAAGIRIRQHRLARGWTIDALAADTGLSIGTISGIEGGKGYSPETLIKLAKAFDVSVGMLFDVDPRKNEAAGIWSLWNAATADEKQRIVDYAEGVVSSHRTKGKNHD